MTTTDGGGRVEEGGGLLGLGFGVVSGRDMTGETISQ
jgi:hypothetical protein